MMMMSRFSERAAGVMFVAQSEALFMQKKNVGTEHLLYGLLSDMNHYSYILIEKLNVNIKALILSLDGVLDDVENAAPNANRSFGDPKFSEETKRVMFAIRDYALENGHEYVGTIDILFGILIIDDCVAARILRQFGVTYEIAKNMVDSLPEYDEMRNNWDSEEEDDLGGLTQFGQNLNEMARKGKIDPVIGREKEIERVIQILIRRKKNNPVLIGEPGVGKTAIAEGLAQKIVQGDVPEILQDKIIFSLNLSSMVAGTKYRGEFEERLETMMDIVQESENIIIFIDELHTIIGAGGGTGSLDTANILKPVLAGGQVQVIGATTLDEYKKYVEKDAALDRRFQKVMVETPTIDETITILHGLREYYEVFHEVIISDAAITAAAKLSERYITDRSLPDKAIDIIDEAASKVRLAEFVLPEPIKSMEVAIDKVKKLKAVAVEKQEFEKAAKLRDRQSMMEDDLEVTIDNWRKGVGRKKAVVDEENVAQTVSAWTGIPVQKLTEEESKKLLNLEEVLHKRVVAQDEAVAAVAKAVRRAMAGIKDPKRPIGSFMFLGPTGVGKTELAKALAESIFGDENTMIRFDMSEYMEKHSVARLIGAPPGYIGYDDGGQLTDLVRRKPYSVVLLDEIEKAHPDIFNILLQILEDGRLTDGKGRVVNFKNTLIIMTSNVGANYLKNDKVLGFALSKSTELVSSSAKKKVLEEVKKVFRPEFLNRVDEQIVFDTLQDQELLAITKIMLTDLEKRLAENKIVLELDEPVYDKILAKGRDIKYGARPLRRAIQKFLEDEISEIFLRGEVKNGGTIRVSIADDKFVFATTKKNCRVKKWQE